MKITFFNIIILSFFAMNVMAQNECLKPRVIATTDGELDDRSSMVRFLMYSCDYEVDGIVQVASHFQPDGHSSEKWVESTVDLYGQCLSDLRIHNADYPDVAYLKSVIKVGDENSDDLDKTPSQMSTKDTPGSQLIIDALLDTDPRPVHILHWGGAITTAYAFYKLKTAYTKEQYEYAVSKARLYCIWYQDAGGQWIEDNIPGVKIYQAGGDGDQDIISWRYVWDYMSVDYLYKNRLSRNPKDIQVIMDKPWMAENVKTNHGPLGASYPQEYTSEGDSPSFMPLVNNGLCQDTNYTLGGWGGRPHFDVGNHMICSPDDGNYNKTFYRWLPAVQNDFAARMDWCVADSYSKANHQPLARINGEAVQTVYVGQTVNLDASPSSDPDSDSLSYYWWNYYDADNANTKLIINDDTSMNNASFVVPDEPDKQLQVILEVTDNGTPQLKSYKRMIFNISIAGQSGVNNPDEQSGIKFFPDPVTNELNINIEKDEFVHGAKLQIYSIDGHLILSRELYQANSVQDVTDFPKGLYCAKVTNLSKNYSKLFIKN